MIPGKLSDFLLKKKRNGEKVLVSYLIAGYPNKEDFQRHLFTVLEVSDLVEIGFPFSDPLADGTTIQKAYHQVLERGLNMEAFLRLLAPVASWTRKPLVLMSYLNPVLQYGIEKTAFKISKLNFRGILFPDLPLEEEGTIRRTMNRHGIELIYLLSPTTGSARAKKILQRSQAFVYFVSLKGVTGARPQIPLGTLAYLQTIRRLTAKPLYVGFGISRPSQVAQVSPWADGVIVGSALLERLKDGNDGGEKAKRFLRSLQGGFKG